MQTWQKIRHDPILKQKLLAREQVMDVIRKQLKSKGFREVFTPILVAVPSAESNLEVFETQLKTANGLKRRGFLIMSPEYAIKKLLAGGVGSCFEITRCFRNEEEVSRLHNPEFTMLEWYRVGAGYQKIMEDVEELVIKICQVVRPEAKLNDWWYQGERYDLTPPWPRISVLEAFEKYAGIGPEVVLSTPELLKAAKQKGYQIRPETTWEQVFYQIFFNEIESQVRASHRPAFIYDYPVEQAALAKRKPSDPRLAERFEVFLAGLELGNCFSELIEPKEQAERFAKDLSLRQALGKTEYPMDRDLIEALATGLPEVAGIAVGVDRLVMLATDAGTIEETLFFPGKEVFDL